MYKAQVIHTQDYNEEGRISVICPEVYDGIFEVVYVSPFYNNMESGFMAIPDHGAEIIISQLENDERWYYFGSIVDTKSGIPDPEDGDRFSELDTTITPKEAVYGPDGRPGKQLWKTAMGHTIQMSDHNHKDFNNNKIELRTARGKKILMSDSKKIGAMEFVNEKGDGITVTAFESETFPTRSILVMCESLQRYMTRTGDIKMIVVDGQDLHLINEATGANALPTRRNKTGNINVVSKNRDINIVCKKNDGRIFIDAGGQIQLECVNGEIIIHAAKKISIESDDSIHIKAKNDIRIESSLGNVDIKAGVNATVEGGIIASLKAPSINIDATSVGLKDSLQGPVTTITPATDAESAEPTQPEPNNYGD